MPMWKRHAEIEENLECLKELQQFLDRHILRYRLANALVSKDQMQQLLSKYNNKITDDIKDFNN